MVDAYNDDPTIHCSGQNALAIGTELSLSCGANETPPRSKPLTMDITNAESRSF
jgi:hypothetical protein